MFLNFGQGLFGRIFSALLEVIIFAIVLILVGMVIAALGYAVPVLVASLIKLALVVYFIARVFGFVGPIA